MKKEGINLRSSDIVRFAQQQNLLDASTIGKRREEADAVRKHSVQFPTPNHFLVHHPRNSLDFTKSVTMLRLSRSKYEGRLPEAFCRRGTGAAPASDGRRNLVPGPDSGSLVGH